MSALERALDVLEFVARKGNVSVGEISRELGLPRPTAHRLLLTLQARGYIEHEQATHLYRPGISMQLLASQGGIAALIRLVDPVLLRLREATGETANFAVLSGSRIIYAASLNGLLVPRMPASIGQEVPAHAAAAGKAVLAYLSPDECDQVLGSQPYVGFTPQTFTSRSQLMEELAAVRERGYAVDQEEVDIGAVCIAGPILDDKQYPLGSISVSGLVARIPSERRMVFGNLVLRSCTDVARQWAEERTATLGIEGG